MKAAHMYMWFGDEKKKADLFIDLLLCIVIRCYWGLFC